MHILSWAHTLAPHEHICIQRSSQNILMVNYYLMGISLKFQKDQFSLQPFISPFNLCFHLICLFVIQLISCLLLSCRASQRSGLDMTSNTSNITKQKLESFHMAVIKNGKKMAQSGHWYQVQVCLKWPLPPRPCNQPPTLSRAEAVLGRERVPWLSKRRVLVVVVVGWPASHPVTSYVTNHRLQPSSSS